MKKLILKNSSRMKSKNIDIFKWKSIKMNFSNIGDVINKYNVKRISLFDFENKNYDMEKFKANKKQFKLEYRKKFPNQTVEQYYFSDLSGKGNTNKYLDLLYSDVNSIYDYNEKIILNEIIENLIIRPEQMKKELSYLSENPTKFVEILEKSQFMENLIKEHHLGKSKNLIFEKLNLVNSGSYVNLLRYIKLLLFNFPVLIKDPRIIKNLDNFCEVFSNKSIVELIIGGEVKNFSQISNPNIIILLNIGYELGLIIDKIYAEFLKTKERKRDDHKKKDNSHHRNEQTMKLKIQAEECLFNLFNKDTINLCCNLINIESSILDSKEEKFKANIIDVTQENSININKEKKENDKNKIFVENLDEVYFNIEDNQSLINYTKLIYVLAKIHSSEENKTIISNYIYPANLEKLIRFANESNFFKSKISTEANIILFNQLKNLNFINDKFFIRRIKFDEFDIHKFHIFFNTFIKGAYENDVDLISLKNSICSSKRREFSKEFFDVEKFLLMRKTIDWFIKKIGSSIFFHNQSSNTYYRENNFIRNLLSVLKENLNRTNEPNCLFLISYFFASFSANPRAAFEIIHNKIFDIEEINPEILKDFIEAVDHRLKYFLQYDHEAHLLNKLKKNYYEPYDKFLDSIITNIAKQFLNKLSLSKIMNSSTFEIGLKCIKILFELEIIDPTYKIDDSLVNNIHIIKKKCLIKGAPYLKHIYEENASIVQNLTKILPYVKFYENKFLDEIHKKKNDLIYDEFINSLLQKDYPNIENLIVLYNNIAEYLIIEDSFKIGKNNIYSKQFLITSMTILKKISPILIKKNLVDYSTLLKTKIDQNLIPPLIINLYNLCLYEPEKNAGLIGIFENCMVNLRGLRNLKGHELFRLKRSIMNENTIYQILSNLQTILLIQSRENILSRIITPENIRIFTKDILSTINNTALKVKMNLSPLSHLISSVIDVFDHNDISEVLEVFGNRNMENYHPLFIKALIGKFSNVDYLVNLLKKKEIEFFNFTINWPLFVKSPELVKVILNCHESKLLQLDRYEIINVLAYNHYNHLKLLTFFGESLNKIKRKKKQKQILSEYIFNCTLVNFKVSPIIFEKILDIYEELTTTIYVSPFTIQELCDLIVLSIISDVDKGLNEKYQIIYNHVLDKIRDNLTKDLKLNIKGEEIRYYPSITSEDRFFHKSLTNTKNFNREEDSLLNKENSNNSQENKDKKSYYRSALDSSYSIDKDFEDFFSKKKDLMYGQNSFINDDISYRQIIKNWCVAKIFGFQVESENMINQLNQVLFLQLEQNKKSEIYEKFYLKMISFAFNNHLNISSSYKHQETRLISDFYINNKKTKEELFIIFIPNQFTSYEFPGNNMIPDGIYQLIILTFKKISKGKIMYLFEDELMNYSSKDFKTNIFDKLTAFMNVEQ